MGKALVLKNVNFFEDRLTTVSFAEPIPCTGVTLDITDLTVEEIGLTQSLTAAVTPSDCTEQTVWTSSDTSVVMVENGVVTSIGVGTATITVTCGQYSASCNVTVTDVPSFVAVSNYSPFRRSSTGSAATTDKGVTREYCIIASNKATGLYPIESKAEVDTSPYRFVPIKIPNGTTKIRIACTVGNIRTRPLFFDSTKVDPSSNVGAYCVYGSTSAYDQSSSVAVATFDVPTGITGLDSYCVGIGLGGEKLFDNTYSDYASTFTIEYLRE